MKELLERIKNGDVDAKNQLFRNLKDDRRVAKTIQSLLYDKSVLEYDDVKAEFWRGVLQGVAIVRHDWGDPVLHLIKRGVWQVKSVVRTEINKRIVQSCGKCGRINGSYNFLHICNKCKHPVENATRAIDVADDHATGEDVSAYQSEVTVRVKTKISDRQRHILELLVQSCIDGSNHPQADVARILGISKVRVTQQMNKLRPMMDLTD